MNIIGIMGSPRKQGNTEFLLKKVIEGAKAAGDQSVVFQPNLMNLRGCQACDACKTKGRCVIQDDMQSVYWAIDAADLLLFASPVYMWSMSAQLKLVLDRLYAYMNADYTSRLAKPVKVGLVFTQHRADASGFMPYFHSVAEILKLIGFDPAPDVFVGAGLSEPGQAEENTAMVFEAIQYGRRLRG